MGPWGQNAHHLYNKMLHRLVETSCDQRDGYYFAQRISIAIQHGNAANLLGTIPSDSNLAAVFYLRSILKLDFFLLILL